MQHCVNSIKKIIFTKTKAYRIWIEEISELENFKKWIDSGAGFYSEAHDKIVEEVCKLNSYKEWWGLRESYKLEKEEYLEEDKRDKIEETSDIILGIDQRNDW